MLFYVIGSSAKQFWRIEEIAKTTIAEITKQITDLTSFVIMIHARRFDERNGANRTSSILLCNHICKLLSSNPILRLTVFISM